MKGSNFLWYLLSLLSGLLIAGIILLFNSNKPGTALSIISAPTQSPITVYLSGDIERPGIYQLPINSRLEDLVTLSGSVLPIWKRMLDDTGVIGTTGAEMYRFFMKNVIAIDSINGCYRD